jgi:hypothetical protein
MPLTGPSIPGYTNDIPLFVMLDSIVNDDEEVAKLLNLWGGPGGFRAVDPGRFEIEVRSVIRRVLTAWNSRPGQAVQIDVSKVDRIMSEPFFMTVGGPIDDGVIENLSKYGPGDPPRLMSLRQAADEHMMRRMRDNTKAIARSYAALLLQILCKGTITYSRDGVTISEANVWVPRTHKCLASWATTTTNIPAEMKRFMRLFRQRAGGDPTHILVHPEFAELYLLDNDFFQDFMKLNPAFFGLQRGQIGAMLNIGQITAPAESAVLIEMGLTSETNAGVLTYLWDQTQMVFIRKPEQAFVQYSPRTLDAGNLDGNSRAGFYSSQWPENNPKAIWEATALAAAPAVIDPDLIARFDLTTP